MAEIFSSGEELLKCDINQFDLFIIDLNMLVVWVVSKLRKYLNRNYHR
ncbi:hypothetical protein [Psychrosphaera algicola]|uniref:Uncharacterized protein n=1 Tax=Psychrosphaera algicola TaxID=3023714 RepID=A0ABT5FEK3_9GAMM|nr:hypothetical protein [Psychrosphaera sp. G1-22]MDC2889975.1 hypothetical protein [Psychrosphaera sp. G1-22]